MIKNSFHLKTDHRVDVYLCAVVEPLLCFKANSRPQTPLKRRWTRQSNSRPALVSARSGILARNDSALVLGTVSAVAVMDGRGACCQCGEAREARQWERVRVMQASHFVQNNVAQPHPPTLTHLLVKGSIIFVKSKACILPPAQYVQQTITELTSRPGLSSWQCD